MNRAEKRRQKKIAQKAAVKNPEILNQKLMQDAVVHHGAGRLVDAEVLYQKVLKNNPKHAAALNMVGVIAYQGGHFEDAILQIQNSIDQQPNFADAYGNLGLVLAAVNRDQEAIERFQKAISLKPDYTAAHFNLGNVFLGMKNLEQAEKSFQNVVSLVPSHIDAYAKLGDVYVQSNLFEKALACFQWVVQRQPQNALMHYNIALASQQLGHYDEAISSYQSALRFDAENPRLYFNLACLLSNLGQTKAAIDNYQLAISKKSDFAEAYNNMGLCLEKLGMSDAAKVCFESVIAINPEISEAHNNLGLIVFDAGDLKTALKHYFIALKHDPKFMRAFNNIANVYKAMGERDQAFEYYRKTIELDPDIAEAHKNLALMKKHKEYDQDLENMESFFGRPGVSEDQKMHLAYGLGKAFDELHRYDEAFEYLAFGNKTYRASYDYNSQQDLDYFNHIKEVFNASLFETRKNMGCEDATPIFILGMPRSGTTLVEQILSSHPDVFGAGELRTLSQIIVKHQTQENIAKYPDVVKDIKDTNFNELGRQYVQAIRAHDPGVRFIINKMPGNFLYIGLIKLILPKAKIIHCKRSPEDTCLSIFRYHFSGLHEYAQDLKELGQYYNQYHDLMDHWHQHLPGFVYDIQYEDLIADQGGQTKALLDFCGLEWDDACLDFHKSKRAVSTASTEQVRRPIYKDSVQAWKHYEKQLAPLIEVLKAR
ncbi:MAG: tetratricopeptide repeat protein [Magnetovibrio sp.]|nr:tetratricopeptide repeat protein [Magnetovibrio sp.]